MATLVLADDNLTTQRIFEICFPAPGHEVICFSRGNDMLSVLSTIPCDLLAINLSLPDVDGYEVCRRAREIDPALRLLMLVGAFHRVDQLKARSVGCDHFLNKPFETSALIAAVEAALSGPGSGRSAGSERSLGSAGLGHQAVPLFDWSPAPVGEPTIFGLEDASLTSGFTIRRPALMTVGALARPGVEPTVPEPRLIQEVVGRVLDRLRKDADRIVLEEIRKSRI